MKRLLTLLLALTLATPAFAQAPAIEIVRDAEIEDTLHYLARPIFIAARLKPEDVRITLEGIRDSLVYDRYEVTVDPAIAARAVLPIERMLEMSK